MQEHILCYEYLSMNLRSKRKPVKRSKGYFGVIPLSIYNCEIIYSVNQTDMQFKKSLEIGVDPPIIDTEVLKAAQQEGPLNNGKTVCNDFRHACIIRIFKPVDSAHMRGVLAHEILHAVHYILGFKGMQLHDSSEEAYAYLTGFITTQIYFDLP